MPSFDPTEVAISYEGSFRGCLRFQDEPDSVLLIWVPETFLDTTTYSPRSSRCLTALDTQSLQRTTGVHPTYGYLQTWIEHNLTIPQLDTLMYMEYDHGTLTEFCKAVFALTETKWERCPECSFLLSVDEEHEHQSCEGCGLVQNVETLTTTHYEADLGTQQGTWVHCSDCSPYDVELTECYFCSCWVESGSSFTFTHGYDTHYACNNCATERLESCDECGQSVLTRRFLPDENICQDCALESGILGEVHEWDYRPDLNFHPYLPRDPQEPLYIGMEIETSTPNYSDTPLPYQKWIGGLDSDLLYVKSDSSVINGFEVVTHPMQPRWALENFPFDKFDELIQLGAHPTHTSCGTHIHMNKDSLTQAHLWKLLQVHFRLSDFCALVGGRNKDTVMASFTKDVVGVQRRDLMKIVKNKHKEINDYDRYVAVNLRNEYTIELRYMRGGTASKEIKKNIEWALALYEFTHEITIANIKDGALSNAGYLLWWIQKGDYPNLAEWINDRILTPIPITKETN